jgi:hypothetical protein
VIYPLSTHHFCGELAVSQLYTTVRVPAWDTQVLELLYSIGHSMLSYSAFDARNKGVRREPLVLQSLLLKKFCSKMYPAPIRGIHPKAVLAGPITFQVDRAISAIRRRVEYFSKQARPPIMEDWDGWLFRDNMTFIASLLNSGDTKISSVVDSKLIDRVITTRDMRLLGKLLTAEIIMRLIETRWQRFW